MDCVLAEEYPGMAAAMMKKSAAWKAKADSLALEGSLPAMVAAFVAEAGRLSSMAEILLRRAAEEGVELEVRA